MDIGYEGITVFAEGKTIIYYWSFICHQLTLLICLAVICVVMHTAWRIFVQGGKKKREISKIVIAMIFVVLAINIILAITYDVNMRIVMPAVFEVAFMVISLKILKWLKDACPEKKETS